MCQTSKPHGWLCWSEHIIATNSVYVVSRSGLFSSPQRARVVLHSSSESQVTSTVLHGRGRLGVRTVQYSTVQYHRW